MKPRTLISLAALPFSIAFLAAPVFAVDAIKQIPDEYETTSGHGVAMNDAGYAANDAFSAVRANPALLSAQRQYTVNAGYHWPSVGREFFQAGIVDSKTSPVAVGVTYTGSTDDYQYELDNNGVKTGASRFDSPIIRRGVLGVGQSFGSFSAGVGATYVEAHPLPGSQEQLRGQTRVQGFGLNAGVAGALAPQLTAGASVENASNQRIKDYAPRTYRAGVAYQFNPVVTGYLDARQRDRVAAFEADQVDLDNMTAESKLMQNPERMVIASLSAQVQDFLRLIASYGSSATDDRRELAGGVAIVNKSFSLSYTASRPYLSQASAHQAVTLSVDMAM